MRENDCASCRWCISLNDSEGCCLRYPPVLISNENAESHTAWDYPIILKVMHCGEWTSAVTEKRVTFTPPSVAEVAEYCRTRKNTVDPQTFVDFYTSNGWKIGKSPMKSWEASVRTWEKNPQRRQIGFKREVTPLDLTAQAQRVRLI